MTLLNQETPWHVSVLIPARNEENLLPRCLRSVLHARALLPLKATCDIVVAVDSSTDRTHQIAERMIAGHGIVVSTQAGLVGQARALAAEVALARCPAAPRRCWLANTDADCIVPEVWLLDQLAIATLDVQAIAGVVDVDSFADHDPRVADRFRASYLLHPDGTHPHVHGANLGVRADAYLLAGGWHHLATAEDHDLWSRLHKVGARRLATTHLSVITSGRRQGRAPHGFAGALAAHNDPQPAETAA